MQISVFVVVEIIICLLGRLLWSTLCWPCTKIECQKLPGHPNMAKVSLYPPQKIKVILGRVWVQNFRFAKSHFTPLLPWKSKVVIFGQNFSSGLQICEVSLYPLPKPNEKLSFWGRSSDQAFRFGKCHFTIPHLQWKWKVVIFGQIFKSWPRICKVPLKPSFLKIKSSHFWSFGQNFRSSELQSAILPPPNPPENEKWSFWTNLQAMAWVNIM